MIITALASLICAEVSVRRLGMVVFADPVAALLLIPAIAGVAAAVACAYPTSAPLPDPPRAALARLLWILTWTTAAVAAASVGVLAGADVDAAPIARNVLVCAGLATVMVVVGRPLLTWLPPMVVLLVSAMFGMPDQSDPESDGGAYWWAVLIADEVTPAMWVMAGGLFLVVVAAYVAVPFSGARRW